MSTLKTAAPLYDFVSEDGIRHRVWRIDSHDNVSAFTSMFASIPYTYIADGHHRAASAVKVALKRRESHPGYTGDEDFNCFLSVLFPDDQLMIMDYNRIVFGLNGLTETGFMEKISSVFEISPLPGAEKPRSKSDISMFIGGAWYSLHVRAEAMDRAAGDPVRSLDVSVLQDFVLSPVLGIGDPRTDRRISFAGGIRGLQYLEDTVRKYDSANTGDHAVAFAMYPTSIAELLSVADSGMLMPPKSTWFEPKLRSGLFLHEIER